MYAGLVAIEIERNAHIGIQGIVNSVVHIIRRAYGIVVLRISDNSRSRSHEYFSLIVAIPHRVHALVRYRVAIACSICTEGLIGQYGQSVARRNHEISNVAGSLLIVAIEIAFGIGVVYASAIEILDFILFLYAIVYLVKDAVADEGRIEAAAAGDV